MSNLEPKATKMPDGIYVFDTSMIGVESIETNAKLIIEGYYYYKGNKCYLFQGDDKFEKSYGDTNGLKDWCIELIESAPA